MEAQNQNRQQKKLSGSAKKRLKKLLQDGWEYSAALKRALEGPLNTEKVKPSSKRPRSSANTPEQESKRPCRASYSAAAEGVKVGIVHKNYPSESLTGENLRALQLAILRSLADVPTGSQVRFLGCTYRPGWLNLTCADEQSAQWLAEASSTLQPWEGAQLRFVRGEDLPRPHIVIAYIPDDEQATRLTAQDVVKRLRAQNNGLNTADWVTLNSEASGPGQTWTFAIDELSMQALEGLDMRPFFGFGRVIFRTKSRGRGSGSGGPSGRGGPKANQQPKGQTTVQGKQGEQNKDPSGKRAEERSTKPPQKEKEKKGKGKNIPGKPLYKKGPRRDPPGGGGGDRQPPQTTA